MSWPTGFDEVSQRNLAACMIAQCGERHGLHLRFYPPDHLEVWHGANEEARADFTMPEAEYWKAHIDYPPVAEWLDRVHVYEAAGTSEDAEG